MYSPQKWLLFNELCVVAVSDESNCGWKVVKNRNFWALDINDFFLCSHLANQMAFELIWMSVMICWLFWFPFEQYSRLGDFFCWTSFLSFMQNLHLKNLPIGEILPHTIKWLKGPYFFIISFCFLNAKGEGRNLCIYAFVGSRKSLKSE